MNWIERLYEIKNKDLYSQGGEGLILEYILSQLPTFGTKGDMSIPSKVMFDVGGSDGFYLSNSRHLKNLGWHINIFDIENGLKITVDNCIRASANWPSIISIDIDGNDYWVLDRMMEHYHPAIICAEFNAMYTDSRTIAYNHDHVWEGDSYYGFTFEAGKKLAEKHGYKVIFQTGDMNMFMVRADLIEGLTFPEVTYKQNTFFKMSNRPDWVMI